MYVKVRWIAKQDLRQFYSCMEKFLELATLAVEKSPYGDILNINFRSGLIEVYSTSSKGNWSHFMYNPDYYAIFIFGGRRHALNDPSNRAGLIFKILFENNQELLEKGEVEIYETHAPQAKWWECGVKATIPIED